PPPPPPLFPYTTLFRSHLRDAAHRAPGAELGVDPVLVVDAVLDREHSGVGAQDRPEARRRVVGVERLDTEEHGIRPVHALEPLRSEEHTSELQSRSDLV